MSTIDPKQNTGDTFKLQNQWSTGFVAHRGFRYVGCNGDELDYNTDFVLDLTAGTLRVNENTLTNADNLRYYKVRVSAPNYSRLMQITDLTALNILTLDNFPAGVTKVTVRVEISNNDNTTSTGRKAIEYYFEMSEGATTTTNAQPNGTPVVTFDGAAIATGATVPKTAAVNEVLDYKLTVAADPTGGVLSVTNITAASDGVLVLPAGSGSRFQLAPNAGINELHSLTFDTSTAGSFTSLVTITYAGGAFTFTVNLTVA